MPFLEHSTISQLKAGGSKISTNKPDKVYTFSLKCGQTVHPETGWNKDKASTEEKLGLSSGSKRSALVSSRAQHPVLRSPSPGQVV